LDYSGDIFMAQGVAYRAGMIYLAGGLPDQPAQNLVRWGGQFFRWSCPRYRQVTEEEVRADVTRWLARNPGVRTGADGKEKPVTAALVRDAMVAVYAETAIPDAVQPGTWLGEVPSGAIGPYLATPAGVIDLGRLADPGAAPLPNGPDFFALAALPVGPDPSAACPGWEGYLADTFDEAGRHLLQEVFGYCLLPDCRFEKFFFLPGPPDSGKSTAAEVLTAVLGPANTSALPLERFGERFALAGLVGKLANVVFDASEVDAAGEGHLKAMVSGEPVAVEEKHRPVATARLTAKHVFLANALPRFRDTTGGVWRRLVLLPFERVCPPGRRDPGLKHRLRAELPAVTHWALRGLARLLRQGGFTPLESGTRMAEEYRRESNPVALFLDAECVADPEGRVGRQALYARYSTWAAANGHSPQSSTRFYREVKLLHPQPGEDVRDGRGGDRMFVGFRLCEASDVMRQDRLLSGDQAKEA
jgi:P4 family phage/plasmid primase-like protien